MSTPKIGSFIACAGCAVLACQSFITDPTEACLAVERAAVNYHARCDTYPPVQAEDGNILAYCQAVVHASGSNYSVDVANACLRAIHAATPDCSYYSNAACEQLGTLPAGAACMDDMQCASGVCGFGSEWPLPGVPRTLSCATCAQDRRVLAQAGEPCTPTALGTGCDAPWVCDPSGVCVARASEGKACIPTINRDTCSSHFLACVQDLSNGGDTCQRLPSLGSPCLDELYCDLASVCGSDYTCQDLLPVLYAGQSCDQAGYCASELTCRQGSGTNPSLCTPLNGIGQPCWCQNYLDCVNGALCGAPDFTKCR